MHPSHLIISSRISLFMVSIAVLLLLGAVGLSLLWSTVAAQGPEPQAPEVALGTGFTYQGQLKKNNAPVNDNNCSMTFSLWDLPSNGLKSGVDQVISPVAVVNGLFTVVLNGVNAFGASAFTGQDRWLQAAVQCAGDGSPVTLSRQRLTAAPYALFSAAPWVSSVSGLTYNAGNVGIGTTTPAHHFSIFGGPLWTSNSWSGALEFSNGSALGWQANAGGYHFGLGQSTGGLYFFHTASNPGTTASPAIYDMIIADGGNVAIGTNSPLARLHVKATSGDTARFESDRGPNISVIHYGTNGDWYIRSASSSGNVILQDTGGNVGIGTTTPSAKFFVRGTSAFTDTFVVENSVGIPGLVVRDDRTVAITSLFNSSTTHACYYGSYNFSACSSAAEYVPTIDDGSGFAEAADVVSIAPNVANPYDDEHSPFVVTKSNKPCDDNLLGYIVNPESGADGKKLNEHYLPLAIYGYFPAKVTLENGAIRRGDALTSSSKPGYGMKATQACKIIGYALEDADEDGMIQVFAQHGENAAPEVAALRTQVKTQTEQLAAQQKQIDALVARLTALEHSAQSGGAPTLASR
jgi:hypothetical protein